MSTVQVQCVKDLPD